jgi:hypothetical protein
MMHKTMSFGGSGQQRNLLTAVVLVSVSGCGAIADMEMFDQSNAALVANMGEACEIGPVGANETVVNDDDIACEPGYCVGQSGQWWTEGNTQGICTCRCDGPEGTGPLCDCGSGFECKELIKDFGLSNSNLVGSYCVPTE